MNRSRVEQLREWMPPDIDAAIVETEVNRFYFSDFSSSAGTFPMPNATIEDDARILELLAKEGIR